MTTFTVGSWVDQALCAQTDPELFFPEKGGNTSKARAVCRACPVQAACLDAALTDPSLEGIWGGLTFRDRQEERKRRGVSPFTRNGPKHPSRASYLAGCRCAECTAANNAYHRDRYAKRSA